MKTNDIWSIEAAAMLNAVAAYAESAGKLNVYSVTKTENSVVMKLTTAEDADRYFVQSVSFTTDPEKMKYTLHESTQFGVGNGTWEFDQGEMTYLNWSTIVTTIQEMAHSAQEVEEGGFHNFNAIDELKTLYNRCYLAASYRAWKEEGWDMKHSFVGAVRDTIRHHLDGKYAERYTEDKWGHGFRCIARGKKGYLMIDDLKVASVTDGVEFYKDGELDFAISEDQMERLAAIDYDVTKATGALKGILEHLFTKYIDLLCVSRSDFYAA